MWLKNIGPAVVAGKQPDETFEVEIVSVRLLEDGEPVGDPLAYRELVEAGHVEETKAPAGTKKKEG